jgi:riboflavin kinase/FMN adenylyltransferase
MFKDGKGGKQIYSFDERVKMLEPYNVKFVLAVDYNEEFKSIAPLDFLLSLDNQLNVKAFMSGKDFRFGKDAKGKSSTLKAYAEDEENGVWYMPIKDVTIGEEKVSTTAIKSFLDEGMIEKANEFLGENFSVEGEVVSGAHRGARLGFPTANIFYPEYKYPIKQGVYKVKSNIDGVDYFGIASYGARPTFDDEQVVLETYFKDFNGDLYGRNVKIEFMAHIRDIEKFEDETQLEDQLKHDLLI